MTTLFDNLPELPSLTEENAKPKKAAAGKSYKLDLFKQTLPALFACDFDFYDRCSEAEQKEITPLILMRWVSLCLSNQEAAVFMTNTFVNEYFWNLSKYPELQWKLLCVASSEIARRPPRMQWFQAKRSNSKTPKLDAYLLMINPHISDMELEIIKNKIQSEDEIRAMVREFGEADAEAKDLIKEFKAHYGKSSNETES